MVDELEASAERTRQGEAAMRRFLADASHELRTPVAALQASAETLLREQPERPDRDALEAPVAGDAARLGRLVDELLGAGPARRPPARTPTTSPPSHARSRPGPGASAAAVLRGDRAPLFLIPHLSLGHPEALARAVRNLLDNAVSASPSGGRVAVQRGCPRRRQRSSSACDDEGPGVPAAERERIFERFVRLDGSRNAGGSGLGPRHRAAHRRATRRRPHL